MTCASKMAAIFVEAVTPKGKSSVVWKYFGYFKGETEATTKPMCKICGTRAGGTTNLQAHLCTWHRTVYDELYLSEASLSSSMASSKQATITSFVDRVEKLSPNCEKAKRLTRKICEMIARDLRPVSIVDDVGGRASLCCPI